MKLEFIKSGKILQSKVLIGKSGSMRIKNELASKLGFAKGQNWLIGTDKDEYPKYKHIYLLTNKDSKTVEDGFKLNYQNNSWSFSAKTLIKELDLKVPLNLSFEMFEYENYKGIKMRLP